MGVVTYKNDLEGPLHIVDADLFLKGKEKFDWEGEPTKQMKACLLRGDIMDASEIVLPSEIAGLNSAKSINFVKACDDLELLGRIKEADTRKGVLSAVDARIAELTADSNTPSE